MKKRNIKYKLNDVEILNIKKIVIKELEKEGEKITMDILDKTTLIYSVLSNPKNWHEQYAIWMENEGEGVYIYNFYASVKSDGYLGTIQETVVSHFKKIYDVQIWAEKTKENIKLYNIIKEFYVSRNAQKLNSSLKEIPNSIRTVKI